MAVAYSYPTPQDALHAGLDWRCPECKQLLGRSLPNGTVETRMRRRRADDDYYPAAELRIVTVGGTITVACWRCGNEVVFRVSGATVIV